MYASYLNFLHYAFLFFPFFTFAADGTIDGTNRYAWSENLGWVDFGSSEGNVQVQDIGLSGYAWSESSGWISLSCGNDSTCDDVSYAVLNDGNGNLSGEAWGENIGWFLFDSDYGQVTIDSNGTFHGIAWRETTGWMIFNCDETDSCNDTSYFVSTTWCPTTSESGGSNGGGGGGSPSVVRQIPDFIGPVIEEEEEEEEEEEVSEPEVISEVQETEESNQILPDEQDLDSDEENEDEVTEITELPFEDPQPEETSPIEASTVQDQESQTNESFSIVGTWSLNETANSLEEHDELLYGALAGSGAASTPFFFPLLRTYRGRKKKKKTAKKRSLPLLVLTISLSLLTFILIYRDYQIPNGMPIAVQADYFPVKTILQADNNEALDAVIEYQFIQLGSNDPSWIFTSSHQLSDNRLYKIEENLYIPYHLSAGVYQLDTSVRIDNEVIDHNPTIVTILPPSQSMIFLLSIVNCFVIFLLLKQYANSLHPDN